MIREIRRSGCSIACCTTWRERGPSPPSQAPRGAGARVRFPALRRGSRPPRRTPRRRPGPQRDQREETAVPGARSQRETAMAAEATQAASGSGRTGAWIGASPRGNRRDGEALELRHPAQGEATRATPIAPRRATRPPERAGADPAAEPGSQQQSRQHEGAMIGPRPDRGVIWPWRWRSAGERGPC